VLQAYGVETSDGIDEFEVLQDQLVSQSGLAMNSTGAAELSSSGLSGDSTVGHATVR
jgi:hypothetical protein